VFRKSTTNFELCQVEDIELYQPFFLRLVRKSTLILICSDKSIPNLEIPAISNGEEIKELVQLIINKRQLEKCCK